MKNSMKTVISLLLIVVFMLSNVVVINAEEINTVSLPDAKTYTFSLEEAIDYASKNNTDIITMKFSVDQLGYTVSSIRTGRKNLVDAIDALQMSGMSVTQTISSSFDSYLLKQKYTERQLQSQKVLLEKTKSMTEEMTKLMVENAYYNVLISKIAYEDSIRNLDVIKKQTEAGKIKVAYGTLSEMNFKSLEISQNAAEMALVNAEFAYKEAKMDLNELLGIELDAIVNLTTTLAVTPKEIAESENKKDELRKNDITFLTAENNYNFKVEYEKYAKAYYGSSNSSYKAIKEEQKAAEITYNNAKNTLERKIMSTYNNLDVLKKSVKIMSDKKDLMSLALGIAEIRKTYGTATEDDVVTASINYNSAVNEYYQTVMNYNMLVSMLDKNIMG